MAKIDMIALRDFTYSTRRLKAGDSFQARNPDDAKILARLLGKATYGRPIGSVAAPPATVVTRAKTAVKRKRRAPAKK